MLRFQGGAKGMIWASQVAPGHENGLKLRVYGEKGGLEWTQADPNYLWYTPFGEPKRLITRAGAGAGPAAARVSRVPSGHPEGYLEGFANIYQEAARAIRAARKKDGKPAEGRDLPDRPGRRRGRRLRRGLRQVVEEERGVDEIVGEEAAGDPVLFGTKGRGRIGLSCLDDHGSQRSRAGRTASDRPGNCRPTVKGLSR